MLILGIDPGLQITGYAILRLEDGAREPQLVEAGVLRFKSKDPMPERLLQLATDVGELMDEHKPDVLAIEELYAHYAHPRTAIIMGHGRGVVLLQAQQRGIAISNLGANEVKKSMTGHGHASKEQMQLAVQSQYRLPEPPSPPDIADAIAIATCHARRIVFGGM